MDWRRSSFCYSRECVETACSGGARWVKASGSCLNDCTEVAMPPDGVLIRDSKDPDGPHLHFTRAEWQEFISRVQAG